MVYTVDASIFMTRKQLQQYFPDLYSFFQGVKETHPFWCMLERLHLDDMKQGRSFLPDLEHVFSSLHLVDGHHVLRDHIENVETEDELLEHLTKLYVAYLYRKHECRIVKEDHGYDIELEIADQLLALGVVHFQDFSAIKAQFAPLIKSEIQHLTSLGNGDENGTSLFVKNIKKQAGKFKKHPKAQHQILAAVTDHSTLHREIALADHLQKHNKVIEKDFPHIAGIILIDPTPGTEKAKFIPFHGNDDLEILLNKSL